MEKILDLSKHVPEFSGVKERFQSLQLERKRGIQCFHLAHCTIAVQCVRSFHDSETLPPRIAFRTVP